MSYFFDRRPRVLPAMRYRVDDFSFATDNDQYRLLLPAALYEELRERCIADPSRETGSILVGYYDQNHARAVVTHLPPRPPDSESGRTFFRRGRGGLQRLLDRLWPQQRHYLGEWHFHPSASPQPSHIDDAQMRRLAETVEVRCPEPILVVLGNPAGHWRVSATVYPLGRPIEMRCRSI